MALDPIGRTTMAGALQHGLDVSAARVRDVADRVAKASAATQAFALDGNAPATPDGPIDVEGEMARLAEEQARYEAIARLLAKTYAGYRTAIQEK